MISVFLFFFISITSLTVQRCPVTALRRRSAAAARSQNQDHNFHFQVLLL